MKNVKAIFEAFTYEDDGCYYPGYKEYVSVKTALKKEDQSEYYELFKRIMSSKTSEKRIQEEA